MTVRTDGGDATVPRDSNCSLGPAASGPPAPGMPGVPGGPMGAPMGAPMGPNFNVIPGSVMSPQECAALGVPPGTRWGASNKPSEDVPAYGGNYGGSNAGESFLSI